MLFDKYCKIFCDLVESKSFTRAAQLNSITQSAVSQQLKFIERQLNAKLLDRSGVRKIFLTAEGEIFYQAVRDITNRFDQALSDVKAVGNIVSGNLHISAASSVGFCELIPVLKRFHGTHPSVDIRIKFCSLTSLYTDVTQGASNIGIADFLYESPKLQLINLTPEPFMVVCHPKHPFSTQETINPKTLSGQHLVTFESHSPARRAINGFFKGAGVEVDQILEFDNIEAIKKAVEMDMGFALLPAASVAEEVGRGTLVKRKIKGNAPIRPLAIVRDKRNPITAPMKLFIEELQTASRNPTL